MLPPDEQFQQVQHIVVPANNAGQRIDNFLMGLLKTVPRSLVYRLLRTGQVRVNKGRIKPGFKLSAGDDVRIPPVTVSTETQLHLPADLLKTIEATVIFEDDQWIVINKPQGLAVHGGTGVKFGVIDLIQRVYDDTSISLVHRLDRETSGCLVLAKSRPASIHFQQALRAGQVEKRYRAWLKGCFENSVVVDAPLLKNQPEAGERMVVVDRSHGKDALSRFTPVQAGRRCSLVDVSIETGRTHQIRVHSAHIGHPVVGDPRYGDRALNREVQKVVAGRMYLHAAEIAFPSAVSGDDTLRFQTDAETPWSQLGESISVASGQS